MQNYGRFNILLLIFVSPLKNKVIKKINISNN